MSKEYKVILKKVENVDKAVELLKYMLNVGEQEAKNICDHLPRTLYKGISKAEAISIENTLAGCGAELEIIEIEEEPLYKVVLTQCDDVDDEMMLIKAIKNIMHISTSREVAKMINEAPTTLIESTTLEYAKNLQTSFGTYGVSNYIEISEM